MSPRSILDAPLVAMFWWPVYQVIEEYEPALRAKRDSKKVKFFPDGSAWVEDWDELNEVWSMLISFTGSGLKADMNTMFRSLAPFPVRRYQLVTSGDYFEKLGDEQGFIVGPNEYSRERPNERRLDRLTVDVHFYKSPSRVQRSAFESAMVAWSRSVASEGIADEGPASISGPMEWRRKDVRFRVDVSRSGQNTLNWLTLSALNYGAKHAPVAEVYYGVG